MMILRVVAVVGYAAYWIYSLNAKDPNIDWQPMFEIACFTLLIQSLIRLVDSLVE